MPNTALNRTEVALLTNKSGGSVARGDTVILSSGTASAFTTTTSANYEDDIVAVVFEPNGIANDAIGLVALAGYVPLITLASSASLGDYVYTHTVAKQAQRSGTKSAGAFGQVLATGTSPAAILFGGLPKQTGAASTDTIGDLIILRDEKAQNTSGGTFTTGAWQTRVLNTESVDTGNHCTLASNQFTLAAGTYRIRASAPAFFVGRHQTRLQNVTDTATVLTGTSEFSSTTNGDQTRSWVIGRFTIGASKALEIQHRSGATQATNGFGVEANLTTEVYTVVELTKEP